MTSRTARIMPPIVAQALSSEEQELGANPRSALGEPGLLEFAALHLVSDEGLMEKLKAGEHDALTILFKRHNSLVYRVARSILRSDTEAEDVVQEVFVELFRAVGKYDPGKSTLKVWLLMYAYHRTIDKKRNLEAKRYYNTEPFEADHAHAYQERGARRTFSLQPAETALLVEQALGMIKPRERLAIELIYYQGLTMLEAAAKGGLSVKTLEHCYYKGLAKLREIIDKSIEARQTAKNGKKLDKPKAANAFARTL
jgi:RNA polymerase sigma-70 factor, ECF subfamily